MCYIIVELVKIAIRCCLYSCCTLPYRAFSLQCLAHTYTAYRYHVWM